MYSVAGKKHNILIFDSTISNIRILHKYLADFGYNLFVAQNASKAAEIIKETLIDLIILNSLFLKNDSFINSGCAKNKSIIKNIPVILIAAEKLTVDRLKKFEFKAVDYIQQPIQCFELLIKINTHLTIKKLNQQLDDEINNKKLVREIVECVSQSLDLYSVFQNTVEALIKVLKCDRLTIVSWDNQAILIKAQSVALQTSGKLSKRIDFDYCRALIAKQQNCSKIDIRVIEQTSPTDEISSQIQSQLSAPILLKKTHADVIRHYPLWGWLIAEQASSRQWLPSEIDLVDSLTAQLAIALRQGLLYQQIKQSNQELQLSNQQLKSSNEQLEELALLDSLTQIFNRRYFDRHLNQEWLRLERNAPSNLSLIICDVDYFKIYNDTYGHKQGDKCLQKLATAFNQVLQRPSDIIARYGGEEFAIILPDTTQAGAAKVGEALRAATKELKIPHLNSAVNSIVTISLGIASTIFSTENTPDLLVEAADQALYLAKSRGRDRIALYRGNVAQSKKSQNNELYWSKRIRQALKHNLFSLYAQPIVALEENNSEQYFEILLRLTDMSEKVISPNNFFEIAARNSLMPKIDMWVIDNLFKTITDYSQHNWQHHRYSINLSGASLNNRAFVRYLIKKLNNYRLPGNIFCFEITESIAIDNLDAVARFINSIKQIGCSFALDDFGKEKSSLSYLKSLPIDYLKIDGSFIKELHQDEISQTIVEGIHHIASGMGLKTVAEFVENEEILDILQNLSVDYAQGYYLGRPEKLTDTIHQNLN